MGIIGRKSQHRILPVICIVLTLVFGRTAECFDADYFKTAEYYASTGLNIINAAGGESLLAYLKPQTAGNFINVIAVDPAKYDTAARTAASGFVAPLSDLVKYEEENSIAAPGMSINSTYSGNGSYITSQSAPRRF
jgi:hypothetical protein